ncbi:MAG: hypothetical protein QOI77_2825 [Blastocatellia bacterium]|nr:hypothetical protein [Blastocatellia bacterium]
MALHKKYWQSINRPLVVWLIWIRSNARSARISTAASAR